MQIQIPDKIVKLLAKDSKIEGAIKLNFAKFGTWLRFSNMPFFPEYTSHGPEHISEVLSTVENIITEESWLNLTAQDAALICMSTLLHDCAMHITEDGFKFLLDGGCQNLGADWKNLWSEFLQKASRFDARKLVSLFGDTQPAKTVVDINNLDSRDKLLIGEFLRKFHPRLAHEIALEGVPSLSQKRMTLEGFEKSFLDLCGLIAESHGLELREVVTQLKDQKVTYLGSHPVFCMSVLRIADYIQIHSGRAPDEMFEVRNLRSQLSEQEWKKHKAIKGIHQEDNDPEALYVYVEAPSVMIYFKIQELFRDIQLELDKTWAVLGEVFGRTTNLKRLGLKIRRIKSNLDTNIKILETPLGKYIPVKASFETSNSDLLKLLVGPLYNNEASIGIRELMQNSCDAVRERIFHEKLLGKSNSLNFKVTIGIVKNDSNSFIIINDEGIGMTPEIVKDYFLCAGASFRRSDIWRTEFEDEKGHSKILRSGRFGVGALAAFLLGNEIEVQTRHVSSEEGIEFKATLDTEQIEMKMVDCPIGTFIKIPLTEKTLNALGMYLPFLGNGYYNDWDWYCLNDIVVERFVNGILQKQKNNLPTLEMKMPEGWHKIVAPGFNGIIWTYLVSPRLICNGINVIDVKDYYDRKRLFFQGTRLPYAREYLLPSLSVFDPDGNLPLNLQRSKVSEDEYPFSKELLESIFINFLANSLLYLPKTSIFDFQSTKEFFKIHESCHLKSFASLQMSEWYSSNLGIGIVDESFLSENKVESIFFISMPYTGVEIPFEIGQYLENEYGDSISIGLKWSSRNAAPNTTMRICLHAYDVYGDYGTLNNLFWIGSRVLVHKSIVSLLKKLRKKVVADTRKTDLNNDWEVWERGDTEGLFDCKEYLDRCEKFSFDNSSEMIIGHWKLDPMRRTEIKHNSPLYLSWKKFLPNGIVPFSMHERKKIIEKFEILKNAVSVITMPFSDLVKIDHRKNYPHSYNQESEE
jgi:molecular chaperone HtpG